MSDADEATRIALDPEHAVERVRLWKAMAFEADKEAKRLQASMSHRLAALRETQEEVRRIKLLAQTADNELGIWQREFGCIEARSQRYINNARAALAKCLEGWE